ncbi:MAG: ribonuclease P protein component [Myxococcales bacterium]|nr:ribonuclease P protein component [Myxococcales bacterium]MDH3845129.1 ribonuclease P protein component [Myxococcales bacterium]
MRGASGAGGDPSNGGQGLPPADRLKKRYEFRQVQLTGRRIHTPHFLIIVQPNALENTRLGITVTKKVGNAVQRNRIKRVVREVFRRNRHLFPPSHDVVFIAKRDADALSYDSVLSEVRRVDTKLREGGASR